MEKNPAKNTAGTTIAADRVEGTLLAAGPHDPRFGGMMLVRVPDEDPQKALDAIRDADPYYQAGVVQYELLVWNVVIGKDSLDKI